MDEEKQDNRIKLDYIGYGLETRYLKRPPVLLDDSTLESVADVLMEIVPDKLSELMKRQDYIDSFYENKLKKVSSGDSTLEYVKIFFIEADRLEEKLMIKKWLRYWLRMAHKIDKSIQPVSEFKDAITEERIEDAKSVPLEDLYDYPLRGSERMVGLCPFREEKTPSFTIFKGSNRFHCFGCHISGDSIAYYMKLNNVDFIESVRGLTNG